MKDSSEQIINALTDYELDAIIDLYETMGATTGAGYLVGIRAARKEAERRAEMNEEWGS